MSAPRRPKPPAEGRPAVFESASGSDPFQILSAEHALIRLHLARILDAAGGQDEGTAARTALASLAESFRLHERREELVLYPVCEQLFGGPEGVAAVLRKDHAAIRTAVERLLTAGERFRSGSPDALDELHRLMEQHFAKEERVLFPLMIARLAGKESARLARRLRAASVG